MKLGAGILEDLKARAAWYASDWSEGFRSGYRVFAPSVYIFFASVIPGLAFGEQIESLTKGSFNGVHVLISTAISGCIQSFVGGQPLLILGVAEPIVLMYGFMYKFADGQGFADVFVPWCTWVTIWCSIFLLIFAFTGLCQYINKFTRFSGELFGMLIAILFMQQAIKGVVEEYQLERCSGTEAEQLAAGCQEFTAAERLNNGLWATILALGTVWTSMMIVQARSWRFFNGGLRSFLADYGVPLLVVAWSGVSFLLQDATPSGIPRRLSMPNTWAADATRNWDAVSRMTDVTGGQIGYAAIPGLIIALLFYFDHNVSAQLAQQKDFQLVRPPAYNWDLALVALLMVMAGLLGIPPSNCVIPQAPMHTKSLITLKQMLVERNAKRKSRLDLSALDAKTKSQLNLTALAGSPAAEGVEGGVAVAVAEASDAVASKAAADKSAAAVEEGAGRPVAEAVGPPGSPLSTSSDPSSVDVLAKYGIEKEFLPIEGGVVPLNVKEQRLSNLIQSLLVGACVGATPAVRQIPKSVLWGYFAYMALESLPGSEFWERLLLLGTDKRRRIAMLQKEHPVYLETVTFRNVVRFTLLQLVYMLAVWGVTWAGAVGIAFPFLIVLLIPARQYVMPKFFDKWTLSQLDAADYEEAPPAPQWVVKEAAAREGAARRSEYEQREALQGEMPGRLAGIKHHISEDEMVVRRRNSVALDDGGGGGGSFVMRRRSGGRSSDSQDAAARGPGGSTGVAAVSGVAGAGETPVAVDLGGAMVRRARDQVQRDGE
eukprot:jgi/Ulvmu1/10654/UM066_0035.1